MDPHIWIITANYLNAFTMLWTTLRYKRTTINSGTHSRLSQQILKYIIRCIIIFILHLLWTSVGFLTIFSFRACSTNEDYTHQWHNYFVNLLWILFDLLVCCIKHIYLSLYWVVPCFLPLGTFQSGMHKDIQNIIIPLWISNKTPYGVRFLSRWSLYGRKHKIPCIGQPVKLDDIKWTVLTLCILTNNLRGNRSRVLIWSPIN